MTDVEHYRPETAVDQQEVWTEVERYRKSLGVKDTTKYAEALTKMQEKSKKMADEIKDALPDEACGFIALDVDGNAVAMEFYRNARALRQRTCVLESLDVAYCDTEESAVVKDVAHSEATELLHHLMAAKKDEAVAQEGSDNIVMAIRDLKGEAVLGETKEGLQKILYCSFGK